MRCNQAAPLKLLFVVTEDWYFVSHRLPLAVGALAAGMEVSIATNVNHHRDLIEAAGIKVVPWRLQRGSTSILRELGSLAGLVRIFRQERPDIVHLVAIKPVLYGSLAARLTRVDKVVSALGGMGAIFSSDAGGRRTGLRKMVLSGFRWLLNGRGSRLVLQNRDDLALLVEGAAINPANVRIIRGAGVDLAAFTVQPLAEGAPMVMLPARMLLDKGVVEFVLAARTLRLGGSKARFVLVGAVDECNPACIAASQLQAWVAEGHVEWLGRRDDMPALYAAATIVCLPSYREGLPKALLEAAASGRAIVTTDVPGCREVVRHGENGLLVPARDAEALAAAIARLLDEPATRSLMGQRGRVIAEQEFSEQSVVKATLDIYRSLDEERQS